MNILEDTSQNRIHEAFHILGLTHPTGGSNEGVMHYPPMKISQDEINKLSQNIIYLHEIYK